MGLDLREDLIHLWTFILDEEAAPVDSRLQDLSPSELQRASAYRGERDRRRFITRRSLLRAVLAKYLPSTPQALPIWESLLGKPCLAPASNPRDLRFSLARASNRLVLALRLGGAIGADLVLDDGPDEDGPDAAYALSRAELEAWHRLAPHARRRALRVAWARKEALLKATGQGLQTDPTSLNLGWEPGNPSVTVSLRSEGEPATHWTLLDFRPQEDSTVCICVAGKGDLILAGSPELAPPPLAPKFAGIQAALWALRWSLAA